MKEYVIYNNQTKKKELLVKECLEDIIRENPIIILDGVPSIYDNDIYVGISEASIGNIVYKYIPYEPAQRQIMIKQVMDYISANLKTFEKIDSQKQNKLLVAFDDVAFDVLSGKTLNYSPKLYVKQKLPFDYNPKADRCFINKAISVWANSDPNMEGLIKEMIGSVITNSYKLDKAFMLLGPKDDGKSSLLELMEYLVGEDNCSHINLKDMKKDTYVAALNGKLLNCADDIDDASLKDTSIFKNVVSHGNVLGKFLYKNPFSFKPYCTLVFSANSMPYIKDRTGDIKKRLIILPFNNNLNADNSARIDSFVPLASETENLQALANIGIEALDNLVSNKYCYSIGKKSEEEYLQSLIDNDPVFYYVHYIISKDDVIGKNPTDLFTEFEFWLNENSTFDGDISHNQFARSVRDTYHVRSENHSANDGPRKFKRIYVEKI